MTNVDKVFSPQYPRLVGVDGAPTNSEVIDFPRDIELRRALFYSESVKHPAKANIHMMKELVEYLTEPGETILDPMSGTGTLMVASEMGRKVILLEIEPIFHYYQLESKKLFEGRGVPGDAIMCLHGPCQDFLPGFTGVTDHVMFSPPYSNVMSFATHAESTKDLAGRTYLHAEGGDASVFDDYQATPGNAGRLAQFQYNMFMTKVYGWLLQATRPGGTMTVIVQDMYQQGKRIRLSEWAMRTCVRQGWQLEDWFCRYSRGTGFKTLMKSKGHRVVENEDLIVLRKPG